VLPMFQGVSRGVVLYFRGKGSLVFHGLGCVGRVSLVLVFQAEVVATSLGVYLTDPCCHEFD
jgi:hypothetical protein